VILHIKFRQVNIFKESGTFSYAFSGKNGKEKEQK
jgi:hypothetical protein